MYVSVTSYIFERSALHAIQMARQFHANLPKQVHYLHNCWCVCLLILWASMGQNIMGLFFKSFKLSMMFKRVMILQCQTYKLYAVASRPVQIEVMVS